MNNLKNIITSLQFTFAIATVLTFGLEMNQQIAVISFLMMGAFLFLTFYLIRLDRKSPEKKRKRAGILTRKHHAWPPYQPI